MKTLFFLLWLLPALAFAQGVVNVNNRGLSPQRLVLDPDGRPLVGTNYVAQILYGPNTQSVTNELGAAMPFRVATTTSPGTWNPPFGSGIRTIPGFPSGATVWMKVRVWNRSSYPTWPDINSMTESIPCDLKYGESEVFSVILGSLDQPVSGAILNFPGLQLIWNRVPVCGIGIRVFEVSENAPAVFIPESQTYFISPRESILTIFYRPLVGALVSTNAGWWFSGLPNACGDFHWFNRLGVLQGGPEYGGLVKLTVTPSPRRPFLDFALTNSRPSLTLRGLPPRSYRIEGSTNLAGWTRLGELSMGEDGNAPVPDAWLATNATQFVRFVPLPP